MYMTKWQSWLNCNYKILKVPDREKGVLHLSLNPEASKQTNKQRKKHGNHRPRHARTSRVLAAKKDFPFSTHRSQRVLLFPRIRSPSLLLARARDRIPASPATSEFPLIRSEPLPPDPMAASAAAGSKIRNAKLVSDPASRLFRSRFKAGLGFCLFIICPIAPWPVPPRSDEQQTPPVYSPV